MNIEQVWSRLIKHQGEEFFTKTGKSLTYQIRENTFYPSRTKYAITKKNFEIALGHMPLEGPGALNEIVRGPAYVYAVLSDKRIAG